MPSGVPTLLQQGGGWEQFIVIGLGIAVVAGGWVVNTIKTAARQRDEARRRRQAQDAALMGQAARPEAAGPAPSRQASLEELAARRRAQLEQLMRGKPGSAASSRPVAGEPTNLTAAEKAERDRARALYQQRAEALRRQQQQQTGRPQPPRTSAPSPSRPPAGQPRRSATPPQRPPSRSTAPPRQQPLVQRAPAAPPPSRRITPQSEEPVLLEEEASQRRVSDAPVSAASTLREGHEPLLLRGVSLREAMILREILGPPVALRSSEPSI